MKKSILVTGATSGIGRAATELFASHGYLVFATYRKTALLTLWWAERSSPLRHTRLGVGVDSYGRTCNRKLCVSRALP